MQSTKWVHEAYAYQRSRSSINHGPNLSDSIFLNFFSSITTNPIEAKFHVEPPWDGEMKACSNGPSHMTKMVAMPKNFKILLLWNERPITLKLGMQHWGLEYYQICSNDASGLTLPYFMARSNLVPYAFVWEKVKATYFFRNYCNLWYKPRHDKTCFAICKKERRKSACASAQSDQRLYCSLLR